jgi:hypothetical protein
MFPFPSNNSVTTVTTHPNVLKGTFNYNFYRNCNNVTSLTLTGMASDDINLDNMALLDRSSIIGVLQHLDTNMSGKTCTFYTGGLTVLDDSQHSVQGIYDLAVQAGWTINNLTIVTVKVTSPSNLELDLSDSQTIIFDTAEAWTATTSSQDVTLSSSSGSAGNSHSITVSIPSGLYVDETVTITSGSYSAVVRVYKERYRQIAYINTNGDSFATNIDTTNKLVSAIAMLKVSKGGTVTALNTSDDNWKCYRSGSDSIADNIDGNIVSCYYQSTPMLIMGITKNSYNNTVNNTIGCLNTNMSFARSSNSNTNNRMSGTIIIGDGNLSNLSKIDIYENLYANIGYSNPIQMKDDTIQLASFVPAMDKETNYIGLYETMSKTFYPGVNSTGPS